MGVLDTLGDTRESLEDSADYAGDVVFVREDESTDRWDGEEFLTEESETFDYFWDHGDETGEDQKDVPGAALWGTDDSFAEDPTAATDKTLNDAFDFATGNFDTNTPDGSGDGSSGRDLPWKYIAAGFVLVVLLIALRPYVSLAAAGAEAV